MSKRWQYKVVDVKATWSGMKPADIEEKMNPLGQQGWELVAAVQQGTTVRLYLKREQ